MREILFRAKRIDNDEWMYGDLLHPTEDDDNYYIEDFTIQKNNCHAVIPETIGQYTGLTDKNGKKIFEGDIVKYDDAEADYEGYHDSVFLNCGEVEISAYDGICFTNRQTIEMSDLYESATMVDCEVIGNIYDNLEYHRGDA